MSDYAFPNPPVWHRPTPNSSLLIPANPCEKPKAVEHPRTYLTLDPLSCIWTGNGDPPVLLCVSRGDKEVKVLISAADADALSEAFSLETLC